jgi:mRNA interferase MazF
MVEEQYIPERGDYVWLNFDPQSGHEQRGKRPAIVLSPKEYNAKVGLGIFCPITSHEKGYPFEVKISNKEISGVILADQIKSLDWRKRNIEFISTATDLELQGTIDKISTLIIDM